MSIQSVAVPCAPPLGHRGVILALPGLGVRESVTDIVTVTSGVIGAVTVGIRGCFLEQVTLELTR